jgi:hypothetical protein
MVNADTPAQAAPAQQEEVPWYKQPIEFLKQGAGEIKQAFSSPEAYAAAVSKNIQTAKDFYGAVGEDVKAALTSPSTYLGPITGGAVNAVQQLASGAPDPGVLHNVGGNLGVNTPAVERDAAQGKYGAVVGHAALPLSLILAGGGKVADETVKGAAENMSVPSARGVLSERMAEVPPGEQFSRAEVYNAARDKGVNLDLAQATDHPIPNAVKKVNQYSLAAKGKYEGAQQKNIAALENWADEQLGKYSESGASREELGGKIQGVLRDDLAARKSYATGAFDEIDQSVGKNGVDARPVEEAARNIIESNRKYYESHPELLPKQAWKIIDDLANRGPGRQPEPNTSFTSVGPRPGELVSNTRMEALGDPAGRMTWGELHRLRSDLMDVYRNNPDIMKGRSEAWLQQMVSTIDDAMTSSSSGLKGSDLQKFRDANQVWQELKNTYDNPQSTLYHALRGQYPSQIPGMLTRSPELAKQVRATIGSLEGPFQRQFVENILNAKDGQTLDLKNLNTKVTRIPNDLLEAMLGTEGAKQLRLLGKVSQKVMADQNPSGTAKSTVPVLEVGNVVSNPIAGGATLAGQHVVGKAMNNPRLVDFLTMKPSEALKMSPKNLKLRKL